MSNRIGKPSLQPASEPITESDEFIEQALRYAGVPALMMSMIHMSGDSSLLDGEIRPNTAILGEIQGFLPMGQRDEIRRQALEVIKRYRYRDSGCRMAPLSDKSTIRRMMSFVVGEEVPEEYVPLMLEEMNLDGVDSRSFHWRGQVAEEQRRQFQVVVIGAGVGGILAGIRLQQAGIGFRIFEKNPDVGGAWYENTYPGVRVDTPNYFYCYSFVTPSNPIMTGASTTPHNPNCKPTCAAAPAATASAHICN